MPLSITILRHHLRRGVAGPPCWCQRSGSSAAQRQRQLHPDHPSCRAASTNEDVGRERKCYINTENRKGKLKSFPDADADPSCDGEKARRPHHLHCAAAVARTVLPSFARASFVASAVQVRARTRATKATKQPQPRPPRTTAAMTSVHSQLYVCTPCTATARTYAACACDAVLLRRAGSFLGAHF